MLLYVGIIKCGDRGTESCASASYVKGPGSNPIINIGFDRRLSKIMANLREYFVIKTPLID